MKVDIEITKCADCLHVTNSSKEHDCSFTSAPSPCIWWCKKDRGVEIINPHKEISKGCPYRTEAI